MMGKIPDLPRTVDELLEAQRAKEARRARRTQVVAWVVLVGIVLGGIGLTLYNRVASPSLAEGDRRVADQSPASLPGVVAPDDSPTPTPKPYTQEELEAVHPDFEAAAEEAAKIYATVAGERASRQISRLARDFSEAHPGCQVIFARFFSEAGVANFVRQMAVFTGINLADAAKARITSQKVLDEVEALIESVVDLKIDVLGGRVWVAAVGQCTHTADESANDG